MSQRKVFDISGFDPATLDIEQLKLLASEHLADHPPSSTEWTLTTIQRRDDSTILRADPADAEKFPVIALKYGAAADVRHEYAVLNAIQNFGFSIGPRAFHYNDDVLICEWMHGDPLKRPPNLDDENKWHRMMAVMGVPNNLPFAEYASQISMRGTAPQSPGDLIGLIERQLSQLDANHPDYEELVALVKRAKDQIAPQWNAMPPATLNHLNPRLHHFIWEGFHMRLLSWQHADWCDNAYAVGQFCAHPEFEDMPPSHWVWYRWELARLTKDDALVPRATTYTNLMVVFWAVRLTILATSTSIEKDAKRLAKQRDRYLKRAKRGFV